MEKVYSISGWVVMYEQGEAEAKIITKCIRHFLKAFYSDTSNHLSSVGLISSPEGVLVHKSYIAFQYKGTYQACHAFRTALHQFCLIYRLSLDRGDDIFLLV